MMKQCVLLVGHGSRESSGNREIEKFVTQWRQYQPDWIIELCFIEFAEVLLDQGLDNAANRADRIIVVPLILNAAGHVKMEIPQHLAEARDRHPNKEFFYAPHIGVNDSIFAVIKRQLQQAMKSLGEVAKLARWIFEESEHDLVDIAFTGITHPRLESVVQRQARLGMTQLVILPYYLFTGTLMLRIYRQISHLQQMYPNIRFAHGDYFGFELEIFELLSERVAQTVSTQNSFPCDGCQYREFAAAHGKSHSHDHGHHHHHDHSHNEVYNVAVEELDHLRHLSRHEALEKQS